MNTTSPKVLLATLTVTLLCLVATMGAFRLREKQHKQELSEVRASYEQKLNKLQQRIEDYEDAETVRKIQEALGPGAMVSIKRTSPFTIRLTDSDRQPQLRATPGK